MFWQSQDRSLKKTYFCYSCYETKSKTIIDLWIDKCARFIFHENLFLNTQIKTLTGRYVFKTSASKYLLPGKVIIDLFHMCFCDTQAKDIRLKTMFRPSLGHRLTCYSESFIFVIPVMKEKEKQSSISMCAIYFNKNLFPSKQKITLTGRKIFKTAAKCFIFQRRVSFLSDHA